MIATRDARGALLYDSLPCFLPPSADTNAFLSDSCALFAQSAFFVSFIFNHLRTLLHTSFFSTSFFSTACALFAQKQGVPPLSLSQSSCHATCAFNRNFPTANFCIFCTSLRAIRLFSAVCTLCTEKQGEGVGPLFPQWNAKQRSGRPQKAAPTRTKRDPSRRARDDGVKRRRHKGKTQSKRGELLGRPSGLGEDGSSHGPSAPWPTFAKRERKRSRPFRSG